MKKCVFLDRDGVLNEELGYQITEFSQFRICEGIAEGLRQLKDEGYLLVVVTNQSGIAKGDYDESFVIKCHEALQEACGGVIDALYFAPGYDLISKSLSRKPGSLMFERAMAKFKIAPEQSWMIGDKERDIIPARKLAIRTIHQTSGKVSEYADHAAEGFTEAVRLILSVK